MATPIDRIASRGSILVRGAAEADMAAVREIYAHYVLHSLATFEETPPTLEEMLARWRRVGRCSACPISSPKGQRKRVGLRLCRAPITPASGLSFTIEDSVYVAEGLGGPRHRLCAARRIDHGLRARAVAPDGRGRRRQRAISGSIALHRRFGFELTGTLRAVGFKFGRWVDTPILQRALRPGEQ